ncbi:unknown [Clostridium sp. CAG:1219]|nr:unknown [Clostridium sp. CAG:1219]
MLKKAVIKEAQEELDYLTGDEKIARLEELREKEVKDRIAIEKYGIKIGEERGIKIGIKKGVTEGRKLEQIEVKKE